MSLIANIIYSNYHTTGAGTNLARTTADVNIVLTDSVTGKSANGNNVAVTYTQTTTDNGVITDQITQTVNIPGQSYLIYNSYISLDDSGEITMVTFGDLMVGTIPDPPPPGVCDLVINYINLDKPESFYGAGDAQITINASSSFGLIMYTIYGGEPQASPTFSNLVAGLKSVSVTDANPAGCTAGGVITVTSLNNLLLSDPSVTLSNGNISRWNAAFNPIVFSYRRKDIEVVNITSYSDLNGNIATKIFINGDTAGVSVNDIVYLEAGAYKGTYTVTNVYAPGILIVNAPPVLVTNNTGFININSLRPYYKILTQITYTGPVSNTVSTITSTNRPDSTGLVTADISNFLQSLVQAKDSSDFTQVNYRDSNLSAGYSIAYAQQWDDATLPSGTYSSPYISITDPFYVLYAAKQLGDAYGGNLAAYVPFPQVTDPNLQAKWVTDFIEPAYSNGYPFDIGFIYSEDLIGRQLHCELVPLDINRFPLDTGTQTGYLLNDDGTWLLNQDGSKLIISGPVLADTNTNIPAQLGLNRLLINNSFPADAYYFSIVLKYDDGDTTYAVTQTQTIRIDDAVDDQSVYLRWIGLTGSWNYYRFIYNQEISLDVQNAVIIKNYVSDWANQDSIEEVIGKSAGQKMKVVAEDLSVKDIKGLQSLKYSPKVQMLVNKNPVKWQTVVLNTATFSEYETHNGQAPFSVTFNMPSINIQTQ